MKTMQERHDEVMRRSAKRIAKRKRLIKVGCTLGALAVCVGVGAALFPTDNPTVTLTHSTLGGLKNETAVDATYGNGEFRADADITENGDARFTLYTYAADDIVRVECTDDRVARVWINDGCDKVIAALRQALLLQGELEAPTGSPSESVDPDITITTPYSALIKVTYGDNSTHEWRLKDDMLIDQKTHRVYVPSDDALKALKDALGLD